MNYGGFFFLFMKVLLQIRSKLFSSVKWIYNDMCYDLIMSIKIVQNAYMLCNIAKCKHGFRSYDFLFLAFIALCSMSIFLRLSFLCYVSIFLSLALFMCPHLFLCCLNVSMSVRVRIGTIYSSACCN